ncbi:MAG: hypothetical protein ACTHK8_19420 [Ginsengibacter sp.]
MRKIIPFLIPSFLLLFSSANAQLLIDSASLQVQTGAEVDITGDLTSAKSLPDFGKFVFQSTTDSQSVNMNGNSIPNLEIDNSAGVWLTGNLRVSNSLLFTNGKFIISNHDFSIAGIATVSGMSEGKFVETNGSGQVFKEIFSDLSSYEMPVGAGSIYRPVYLTTSGSNTNEKIGVQVLDNPSTNNPPFINNYLKSNWTITQTGNTGTLNVAAKYSDPTDVSRAESNLKAYLFNGTDWSSSTGSINTSSNQISFPIFIASANITAMNQFVVAKAKVFLQGAYDASSGLMTDKLRSSSLIPLTDPYRQSPYSNYFTEVNDAQTETIDASVLNDQSSQGDNIVDWVFLELENPADNSVLETRSALVQRDGDIVDIDGKSAVTFNNITSDNYTLIVRHRNHLGLSTDPSSYKPLLSEKQSTAPVIDFTTSNSLYGGSAAHGIASDGKYVLWAGNANGDGKVKYTGPSNDKDFLLSTILGGSTTSRVSAYSNGDFNMDGVVKYSSPNNDKDFLLSQVLLGISTDSKIQNLP